MLKLIILEGPRGSGKSTVARELRNSIEGSTLINPTGFKDDGGEGLRKIISYYEAMEAYLKALSASSETFCVIFDRTFFSEVVYSRIYKDYDFNPAYEWFLNSMLNYTNELDLFYMKLSNEEELRERLNRDKVQLFDKVEESVAQSTKQQQYYDQLFDGIQSRFIGHPRSFHVIETSGLSTEDVKKTIMEVVTCQTAEEKSSM